MVNYVTPPRARARDPRRADALDRWGRGESVPTLAVRCPRGHRLVHVNDARVGLLAIWHPPRGRARARHVSRSVRALLLSREATEHAPEQQAQCFNCDRVYAFSPAEIVAAVKDGKRVLRIANAQRVAHSPGARS